MTFDETMKTLESLGSAQTKKTYLRHGMKEPMFGVSFADFGRLSKKIKTDHPLALKLWKSGNSDARLLATMIADSKQLDDATLNDWATGADSYPVADAVAKLSARAAGAPQRIEKWKKSKHDLVSAMAWATVACHAQDRAAETLPETYFAEALEEIEAGIAQAPNRTRYSMYGALIAIGGSRLALSNAAIDAAKRIGHVEVDHGDTACKTPDAIPYIKKMLARKK